MKLCKLINCLIMHAKQRPNSVAVITDDKNWTYHELVLLKQT